MYINAVHRRGYCPLKPQGALFLGVFFIKYTHICIDTNAVHREHRKINTGK